MHCNNQQNTPQQNKLLGLEVIRFASAISVLVWHYQHFFYVADKPTAFLKEQQPFFSLLRLFYEYGFYGVQVFWCISGFIFFWKYRDEISSKNISPKKFFALRFSRLYPLHFASLLLVLILQSVYFSQKSYFFVYQNNDLPHFILQLFFASNWGLESGLSFNGPIWSISSEVLAYFCFFIILGYISKSFWMNIFIIFICLIGKWLNISNPILNCLAFFYAGGLSAFLLRYIENSKFKKHLILSLAFIALTAPPTMYYTEIYHSKVYLGLFLLLYIPVLLFFFAHNMSVHPTVRKVIEAAGNMTYSSYLIHFPIQLGIAVFFASIEQPIPYHSNVFFLGFMLATLIASHYIYQLFEFPAQNFIRRTLVQARSYRLPSL